MKLTIEPSRDQSKFTRECQFNTVTIESLSDDLDFSEMMECVQLLLYGWGFHGDTVKTLEELQV